MVDLCARGSSPLTDGVDGNIYIANSLFSPLLLSGGPRADSTVQDPGLPIRLQAYDFVM